MTSRYLFSITSGLNKGRGKRHERQKLNYAKMGHICQFLTCLVERLANTELPPAVRDEEGRAVDTTALEIQLLQEALGPTG